MLCCCDGGGDHIRGDMFSVGEPLSLQTVLVAGAGVDILFFPGEKLVIDRG